MRMCTSNKVRNPRRFSVEEDTQLTRCVGNCVTPDWQYISSQFDDRTARQLRERWNLYLSPFINLSPWSDEEDMLLIEKVNELGLRWSKIHEFFGGRTQMSIKNRWNTHLKKCTNINMDGYYVLIKTPSFAKQQTRISKQVQRQRLASDILDKLDRPGIQVKNDTTVEENKFSELFHVFSPPTGSTFQDDPIFNNLDDSIFLN